MTPLERREAAYREGHAAGLAGASWNACPYSHAQGSPTRVEALGWRAGYQAAEVDEAEGEHFRTKGASS